MIDDDYTLEEGETLTPAACDVLAADIPLAVRTGHSHVPTAPLLAFAHEFTASLSVYGPRYLDLAQFTSWNASRPQPAADPRQVAFGELTAAYPDTFTTVVTAGVAPGAAQVDLWLALRLTRLTNPIATAILVARARTT